MLQTIEDGIKNIRVQAMKAKYYDFILAFKTYEKDQTNENALLFIQAAKRLAEDDISDIIFTTDIFNNELYVKDTANKLRNEMLTKSMLSNISGDIDYEYIGSDD